MRTRWAMAGLGLALLATACPGKTVKSTMPTPTGSSSPTASPSLVNPSSSTSPTSRKAKLVTFAADGRIWLYDVAKDTSRLIASEKNAFQARFEDASHLTYISTTADGKKSLLRERAIARKTVRTLFEFPGQIQAYSWSPGRTAVAFIAVKGSNNEWELRVWRGGSATPLVRSFGTVGGRGVADTDDISVRWSPDGERVLATVTALDTEPNPTMYIIHQGNDVVPPRYGAQGIWSRDGKTIYFMAWRSSSEWMSLDVATNTETALRIAAKGVRAQLSLDGTTIAYDRGGVDRTVHLYSIAKGSDQRVASGAVGPLWRDSKVLFVSKVEKCSATRPCSDEPPYFEDHEVRAIFPGGRIGLTRLRTTLYADVFYG